MKTIAIIGECMIELNGTPFGTMQQTYGGDTLNTATYLARNTARDTLRVDYISALGTDPLSREMRVRWEADGIDTRHVHTDPAHSPGLYLIQLDADGERTFLYWRNNSAARHLLQQPAWPQTAAALASYDHLYLSGISLAILPPADRERLTDRLTACAAQGVQILFDGNYRPALWQNRSETRAAYARLLPHVHLALMTDDDERALWDDADIEATIARLQTAGVKNIIIKRGAEGALYAAGDERIAVAGERVARVIDTTSAGDAFNAGYLARYLQGAEPEACCRAGNHLAATVIQHKGAIIPAEYCRLEA